MGTVSAELVEQHALQVLECMRSWEAALLSSQPAASSLVAGHASIRLHLY